MWRAGLAVFLLLQTVGCSSDGRPPFLRSGGHSGGRDSGTDDPIVIPPPTPPAADAGGLCGNLIVPVVSDPLNLYFILDMSGSMAATMPGDGSTTRYAAARSSLQTLLRTVGHRVSYGAAWFPTDNPDDGCMPGEEFFETTRGDTTPYSTSRANGPVLKKFLGLFDDRAPLGGTPTAATIDLLRGKITSLRGNTFAFLITDGAPNCSPVECDISRCTLNIDKICPKTKVNCCDPDNGYGNQLDCLDDEATVRSIDALSQGGVRTFVIGMPGSNQFAGVLDRMATAGGTARQTAPYYYPVSTSKELSQTLTDIGLSVSISCEVQFETPPPDKGRVNVFFDKTVVPLDAENGWTWDGDDKVVVVGTACQKLKSGAVGQLQVVAGCPSITR